MDNSWFEHFAWTAPTLFTFVVGIALGYFIGQHEGKKKAKGETHQKFCPHCGESLDTKK
jgi:hypothetical protein